MTDTIIIEITLKNFAVSIFSVCWLVSYFWHATSTTPLRRYNCISIYSYYKIEARCFMCVVLFVETQTASDQCMVQIPNNYGFSLILDLILYNKC